ncbi:MULTISPECIES: ABC transporter ATP-binding protein [unclassified Gemella]|uniref:ABC transporter ATP-binding protein n=1 Tax=unclassified Gemella TaxID=2624949 RepID=UPI0010743682|nr:MULTISPECIES: ABC transporter ATP-binding protein [unclassified Gemella]MBF0710446.1 ABC transporter ATP-binding protein [Gemella sp. GL1.1]MBF0747084.1 ABC transporter ATP-binding protein [Gemella sp. 19428wG2_WT2a]NYS27790.1 ABC transporter ATP-binding protein [Gemella sp. GL1]TFU58574.1 ABC transporter ATP-binding protein [Gemella sp. WT2a]
MSNKIIVKDLVKAYGEGESRVLANDKINFEIEEGELVVILGPSGAGKSTLLNILGGMDKATSGSINVFGDELTTFSENELTKYRRDSIGFVFQFYNLIPNLTVLENVELASEIVKDAQNPAKILDKVGLSERLNNFPAQISGGEQQRVAIARAIAKNPSILLCDEPTGALDHNTGKDVLKILKSYAKENGKTVIIITHNAAISQAADKVIEIYDSKVRDILVNLSPKDIDGIEW